MFPNRSLGCPVTLSGYLSAKGCPEFVDLPNGRNAHAVELTWREPDHGWHK